MSSRLNSIPFLKTAAVLLFPPTNKNIECNPKPKSSSAWSHPPSSRDRISAPVLARRASSLSSSAACPPQSIRVAQRRKLHLFIRFTCINLTGRSWYKAFTQAQTDPSSVFAATAVVVDGITQKLSPALAVGVRDVESLRSLVLQGVNSLVAVELRRWITRAFATDLRRLIL
ncbi:hypothetical protein BDW72DRAFT_191507 [Aspergillus terricola var. indicus]